MFEDLKMNITRNKRKTLSIYVERDGSVSVLAPTSASEEEVTAVLAKKEYQIYKNIAEWEMMNSAKVDREVVNGQSYLYLGRNYRLELVETQETPLMLKNGYFFLRKKDKSKASKHFIDFYKEKGFTKIVTQVDKYKNWLGVHPDKIKIQDLQNRWASCTQKGNLIFHWKCLMAPLDVIAYLVVHELVHLIHKNHTLAFWNEVDKIIPDYKKHIEWLKQHGASLDI